MISSCSGAGLFPDIRLFFPDIKPSAPMSAPTVAEIRRIARRRPDLIRERSGISSIRLSGPRPYVNSPVPSAAIRFRFRPPVIRRGARLQRKQEMAMKAHNLTPHTCANRSTMVCNWSSDDGAPSLSCELDGVIPNLSMPGNGTLAEDRTGETQGDRRSSASRPADRHARRGLSRVACRFRSVERTGAPARPGT